MGQVVQLFPQRSTYVRSQKAVELDNKLKAYRRIEEMEFTKKVFVDLITQLENPKDSFTARSMAAETQRAIDKAVAEYVGLYGSLDNW